MVRGLPLVVLAFLVLAGCSQAPKHSQSDAVPGVAVQATRTTGVIRGLVVDAAIRPLAGATLHLRPGNATATTNQAGSFGFQGLAPGTYFLTASRRGYTTVQQSVDVAANVDEPAPVRLQVEQLPSQRPYHDVIHFRGNQAAALMVYSSPTGQTGVVGEASDLFNGTFESHFVFDPNPTWEQIVVTWDAQSQAAERLQLDQCVGEAADKNCEKPLYSNSTVGSAPLVVDADAKLQALLASTPSLADSFIVWVSPSMGTADASVGATLNQDFSVFTVHTYNYKPPAGYRFERDGEPVDPLDPD